MTAALRPLTFDREGQYVDIDPAEAAGPYIYALEGSWFSQSLDSQIYNCQWHRIDLRLLDLPVGTQVIVSTFANGQPIAEDAIRQLPAHLWETNYTITGPVQPTGKADRSHLNHEFLVQSRPGQYLWLKVVLKSSGYATPQVGSIRVHYPRQSYLSYLPAVYSADDESRWFLERFLAVFQTEWDELEQQIANLAAYFDPWAVPADNERDFLAYLASWLALPLEGDWDAAQKRWLLAAVPQIYAHRGTLGSLQTYLRSYLQHITGLAPEEQGVFPRIVESFRERQRALLSAQGAPALGQGAPIWGAGQVGRLQLDVYAREGEARLVSTGDPQRDLFHEYAHRFRVFLPSAWIRTVDDEQMLRRALDAEKPAHTRYDLCLLEARLRVGVQSTVGLDTIVGGYPVARLARQNDDQLPPSREPPNRLGYDTILGRRRTDADGILITARTRVGIDTLLA